MKRRNFSVVSLVVGEVKVIWKCLLFAWKPVEEEKEEEVRNVSLNCLPKVFSEISPRGEQEGT